MSRVQNGLVFLAGSIVGGLALAFVMQIGPLTRASRTQDVAQVLACA